MHDGSNVFWLFMMNLIGNRQTDSGEKWSLTFHDLGILKPWKLMSSDGTLNDPCSGGVSLMDSCTTRHESFIFCISPQFKFSPGALLAAISMFSEQIANHHKQLVLVNFSFKSYTPAKNEYESQTSVDLVHYVRIRCEKFAGHGGCHSAGIMACGEQHEYVILHLHIR